jgi:sodium/bile acid cotransporter 7
MNLTGFLTAPLILQITLSRQVKLDPVAMGENLLLTLLLPVMAGQVVRALNTNLSDRLKKPASMLNQVIILLLVLTAISRAAQEAGKTQLTAKGIMLVVFAVGSVHLLTLITGWYGGRVAGIQRADRIAVSITGSQKTLAVGTYIAETFFPAYPFAVLPVMFYHATQLVADSLIVDVWKKKASDAESNSSVSTCPRAGEYSSAGDPKDTV